MSTSNLRILVSKIPKVSLKGVAYLAAANFLARALILIKNYLVTYFHSEMVMLYGATLDTRILLFFQTIYMVPMFLLGVLVFYGIERASFNLVLYPTLMLLFLVLIRYGSEAALLVIHFEDHKLDQTPELLLTLFQDIIFIILLLLYVYVHLAFTPIKPTPIELVEGGNAGQQQQQPQQQPQQPLQQLQQIPSTSQNSNFLDAQGFNYATRRNIDKANMAEIEQHRQRNSLLVKEGGGGSGGSVIETDLDAVPTPAAMITQEPTAGAPTESTTDTPAATVKLPKLKKLAPTKKPSVEAAPPPPPETEKEPELDFWASLNGDSGETVSKADGFKTTSV